MSGIFLLPSLAYLTLPPLLPSFLHTYPFSTRPVFLHRVHADRTIPSTTTASRMIIVVLSAQREAAAGNSAALLVLPPWRGVSRRRELGRDRYPKSRLMPPSKCAKRSYQKSAESLCFATRRPKHARTRVHESRPSLSFYLSSSVV